MAKSINSTALQRHIPVLADDIPAEAAPRLARCQPETRALVDVTRRAEHLVRPQRNALITTLAGEPDAFIGQPGAKAASARDRIDQQKTKAGDLLGLLHQKYRSDVLAV